MKLFPVITNNIFLAVTLLFLSACQQNIKSRYEGRMYPPPPVAIKNVDIALVLSGGGARGITHIGVLEVLEKNNIPVDLIVGTSIGSIVGAMYADGLCAESIKKRMISLKRRQLMEVQWGKASSIFWDRDGLSSSDKLKDFITCNLRAKYFSELKIPYIAVATDLSDFSAYEFLSGVIYPAVMASAAIPPIYPPVAIYGREFIDGGVVEPTPVRIAKRYNPKMIIAVDISGRGAPKVYTMYDIMNKSFYVMYYELSDIQASMADIVIHPNLDDYGTLEDRRNKELYDLGKAEAEKMLPAIKNQMKKYKIKARRQNGGTCRT